MNNWLACSTHSYHGYALERALEGIAKSGLQYVELAAIPGHTDHVCPERMSPADVDELRALVSGYGLTISSISGHCNLATDEGLKLFQARLDLAEQLGVQIVNTADGETGTEEGRERFYRNLAAAADYKPNCLICLETHGGVLGDSEACAKTLERINRPNVKINYDPANLVYFEGKRPESDIEAGVANIGHFHIKDKIGGKDEWNFPTIGEGYLDFTKLLGVLQQHGYQGPLSFELEYTPEGPESADYVDTSLKTSVARIMQVVTALGW